MIFRKWNQIYGRGELEVEQERKSFRRSTVPAESKSERIWTTKYY